MSNPLGPKDHARNNFPFCRPIARHLWLFLIREILNPPRADLRFHSIVTTKPTIYSAPKFGNFFHARSLFSTDNPIKRTRKGR